jgi:EAL domain-containing protein (putative c-di-GMP-specific phosphodiesterase class I)
MIGISVDEQKAGRMVRAYQAATLSVVVFSLLWVMIFAFKGLTSLAIVEMFPVVMGIICFLLVTFHRFDLMLLIAQLAFLLFILAFSLIFDIPEVDSARVTHLFLPVLGMLGYLNHLRKRSRAQLALIAASIISFVFLHASPARLPFAEPIPADLRAIGVWLNPTIAAFVFCATIYALQQRLTAPTGIARDLVHALRQGELSLVYQAQVNRQGEVIGAEALLRWNHPAKGPIAPATFIPAAEAVGLMPIVGSFVLEQALITLGRWQGDPKLSTLTLSVNVSASQFNEGDFENTLRTLLDRYRIDPARLRLELTESVLIAGLDPVADKMATLKACGVSFSLDDFGTGFSSLSYLRRLPVAELKIDRSFITGVADSDRDAALVRSIQALAKDLGLATVAEGVETPAQFAALQEIGCDAFQGWLFGRPLSLADFETALASPPVRVNPTSDRRPPRLVTG